MRLASCLHSAVDSGVMRTPPTAGAVGGEFALAVLGKVMATARVERIMVVTSSCAGHLAVRIGLPLARCPLRWCDDWRVMADGDQLASADGVTHK